MRRAIVFGLMLCALLAASSPVQERAGRSYGRRAETGGPFSAPRSFTASLFEGSSATALSNICRTFVAYPGAPGFLGGGVQKAEALVALIASHDPAEGQYAQAQLDDKRKEYDDAEQHLRRAAGLAPHQVERVLDLARYLARRGRMHESDAMFERAMSMAPNNPKVLYSRAETYIKEHRNLDRARQLLEKYLHSALTADDPPRTQAEALLRKTGV